MGRTTQEEFDRDQPVTDLDCPALTGRADGLTSFGPYFAVAGHRPGSAPSTPWSSMAELVDDAGALRQRIAAVRQVLAAGAGVAPAQLEWRVAASTTHLGLAARLLSPAVGVTVLTGRAPAWQLEALQWQPTIGGLFPLSVPDEQRGLAPGQPGQDLARWVATGPIQLLTAAVEASGPVSHRVLTGNVASALHGAAQQIGAARPDLTAAVAALVEAAGHQEPFVGTGRVLPSGEFRRGSCCLIYRAAQPIPTGSDRAVCGDCVLSVRPAGAPVPR